MTELTMDQKREKLRAQLLAEFNGPPTTKKRDKQSVSLCKRESPRSRFLKKPGNKASKEDKITYMPAMKRKPKEHRITISASDVIDD